MDAHFGMLVPDFRDGRMLQLTGMARVNWSAADPEHCSGGTGRFAEFQIAEWRERATAAKGDDPETSAQVTEAAEEAVLSHRLSST